MKDLTFPVTPDTHEIPCPLCEKKTILHSKKSHYFRHGHAWRVGTLWIELDVPPKTGGLAEPLSILSVRTSRKNRESDPGREEAIRQTIVLRLSNGKMGGTNNKIKLIKHRGYGNRNLERFFWRLRLDLSR